MIEKIKECIYFKAHEKILFAPYLGLLSTYIALSLNSPHLQEINSVVKTLIERHGLTRGLFLHGVNVSLS